MRTKFGAFEKKLGFFGEKHELSAKSVKRQKNAYQMILFLANVFSNLIVSFFARKKMNLENLENI